MFNDRKVWLLLSFVILVSCQQAQVGSIKSTIDSKSKQDDAPTFKAPAAPLANFVDMIDYEFPPASDATYVEGLLKIDAPCVYIVLSDKLVDGGNGDGLRTPISYRLKLPRLGTFFDAQKGTIWVWDKGPMQSGDQVIAVGSYAVGYPSPDCPKPYAGWSTAALRKSADFLNAADPLAGSDDR